MSAAASAARPRASCSGEENPALRQLAERNHGGNLPRHGLGLRSAATGAAMATTCYSASGQVGRRWQHAFEEHRPAIMAADQEEKSESNGETVAESRPVVQGRPGLPGARPNVLFIMVDQWPGHLLGCAGHPVIETPTLDRLASLGTRYGRAYSESPICIAARRTLMTGTSPRTHGDRVFNARLPMRIMCVTLRRLYATSSRSRPVVLCCFVRYVIGAGASNAAGGGAHDTGANPTFHQRIG